MHKNLTGGAVVSYGETLPDPAKAFDGSLFYKTGQSQGLYLFGLNQDINQTLFGDQSAQAWFLVGAPDLSSGGGATTGKLTLTGTSTGPSFGTNEELIVLNNTASTTGARSGAIRWTYANSTTVSAQLDTLVGSANNKGSIVLSTRGQTGALSERLRVDETGITVAGNVTAVSVSAANLTVGGVPFTGLSMSGDAPAFSAF